MSILPRPVGSVVRKLIGWRMDPLVAGLTAFADRRRAYRVPGFAESIQRLKQYAQKHQGERCVIIGNGPSLRDMDLSFLKTEITFGLNRIYLLTGELGLDISYYVCLNPLVLEQFGEDIQRIPCPKFVSIEGYPHVRADADLMFVSGRYHWGFSTDVTEGIWSGHTVTYMAMQLAYYMGFQEVVLIGVDHNFQSKGEPNREVVMDKPDTNHFGPNYFPQGVRWQLPDLEASEIAYRLAKLTFERDGRRIVDATVGGRLTVFPKADYRACFGAPATRTAHSSP